MNLTIIRQPFLLDITNTALDARSRIATENDIWDIPNPYVGQYVYCLDNGFTYIITELKEEIVGGITIPDKLVKAYKQLTTKINYRGEYLNEETPLQPAQGDWYYNATKGISYIYQDGMWNIFAKDGKSSGQGAPGEDGDGIQFAFYINNNRSEIPDWNKNAEQNDAYYMADFGWSDNAAGIDKNNRFEWVSIRTKRNKVWSAYSEPRLWSSWGEDGVDGGGTEYIYYRTQTHDAGVFDDAEVFNPVEWAKQTNYATYDWVPKSAGWTDNPEGVDPVFTCEWVSKRTYAPNQNGDLVFGQFGTPALWAKWATDGASALTLSLTNDNTFIVCDSEGNELNADNRPTTNLSVYIGSSNVTSDCELTVTCNKEGVSATISKNDDNTSATLTIDVDEGVTFKDKVLFDITATYKVDEDTEYQGYKRFIVTAITDVNYVYYELNTNANIVKRDKFGEEHPDLLVASVYKFTPQNRTRVLDLDAEGLVLKYEIDNDTVEHVYNSAIDCGNIENTITFRLYMPDGSIDEESIEILQDGIDGTSISLENSVANEEERLQLNVEAGTVVYQVDTGELWLWDGNTWQNLGKIKGESGDSQYIHIKYATGTVDNLMWTDNLGETPGPWMGVYADNNKADAYDEFVANTPYVWNKVKGDTGVGTESITEYYLATSESDGITTSTSGWSTSLQTLSKDKKYLWNYEMVVFSDGNVTKSTPQVIGMYSVDGVGIKSITEYYAISTTNTTHPELDSDDWQTTAPLITEVYKYLWNYEEIVYTNGTTTNTLPAVIGVYGDKGIGAFYIDLDEESILIPCAPDGSLIDGNHVGSSTSDPNLFSEDWYNAFKVMFGAEDVTSDCTVTVSMSDLLGNIQDNSLYISGFPSTAVKVGTATLTATYSDGDKTFTTKTTFTATKVLAGADATFVYHEILPSVTSIVAQLASDGTISNVSPGSIGVDIRKVTELGTSVISTLSNAYIYVTAWTYEESVSDDYTYDVSSSAAPEINLLDWWGNETPAYIEVSLWLGAPMMGGVRLDFERIPVIYKNAQVSADIPDWVSEWDGSEALVNDKNVLAIKAYIGDKPDYEDVDWTGILLGSSVTNVEGLPWYDGAKSFSGIIAMTNSDTTSGYDNPISSVTFALDADTGDAYFKGTVYATSGKFTGELEATSGTFTNGTITSGTITNSVIQNLTVGGGSDLYTVSIGNTDYTDDYNSIFSIKTTAGIYDPIVNIACDYDGTTGYLLISRNSADSSGYFSKTIVSGGEFSVHYSKSLSFSNSDSYNTSCIGISQADGIFDSHLGNLTFSLRGNALEFYNYQNNPHYIIVPRLPKMSSCGITGALCVDEEGVVRVSDGLGGYQYGYGS